MEHENIEQSPSEETKKRSAPMRIHRDELQKFKRMLARLPKKKADDGTINTKEALEVLEPFIVTLHIKKNYKFKEISEYFEKNIGIRLTASAIQGIIDRATAPENDQHDPHISQDTEIQTDPYI